MSSILGDNVYEKFLKPGRLIYNSIDLGLSIEDIEVRQERNRQEIMADQYGTQPIDHIGTGILTFVRTKLTGYSILQLQEVLKGMVVSAGGNAAKFGGNCFVSHYDNSKLLQLKRVDCDNTASADEDYWVSFPKAYPLNESDILTFGPNDQEGFEIEFVCYKDRDAGSQSEGYFWWSGQASTALV